MYRYLYICRFCIISFHSMYIVYIYIYIYKYKCNVCLNAIDLISVLPLLPTKTSNVSMSISSK